MNARHTIAVHSESLQRSLATLQAAWQRLPALDRRVIVTSAVIATGLIVALGLTCQESVRKGERLRAEQRQMVSVSAPAAWGLPTT